MPTPPETQPPAPADTTKGHRNEAYTLASRDVDFLASDDLRAVRLQLELLKPELFLRREQINSTIAVFGGARILPPDVATARLAELEAGSADEAALARVRKQVANARYYTEAVTFSKLVAEKLDGLEPFYPDRMADDATGAAAVKAHAEAAIGRMLDQRIEDREEVDVAGAGRQGEGTAHAGHSAQPQGRA